MKDVSKTEEGIQFLTKGVSFLIDINRWIYDGLILQLSNIGFEIEFYQGYNKFAF